MTKKKSKRPTQPPRAPRSTNVDRERATSTSPRKSSSSRATGRNSSDASAAIPRWIPPVALAGLVLALLMIFAVNRLANTPVAPAGETGATPVAGATQEAPDTVSGATGEVQRQFDEPPPMTIEPSKSYVATIATAKGDIVVSLDAQAAPQTVNNFVFLARNGFYNGLTFHRVEPGFVIQGGDPLGDGTSGPGYTLPAEIGLPHNEGAIAMARRPDSVNPNRESSGSQFYITLAPTPHLDGGYTVFGQVTEGMDVVKSIAVGDVIESVTIQEE